MKQILTRQKALTSELISIIKNLPIDKITDVYLVGSDENYYRIFLSNRSGKAVKIDLFKDTSGNFYKIENSSIFIGDKTQRISPKKAYELLSRCLYNSECQQNKHTMRIVLSLLDMYNFKIIKADKDNHTFASWVKTQEGRDDLIGDLIFDILRDPKLSGFESYDEIAQRINSSTMFSNWGINSFREANKEGSVNPFLVLKLAKMEYEIYQKRTKLMKFAIRDTSGFIYFFKYDNQDIPIKIGRAKDIEKRKVQLQTSLPYDLVTIGYIETDDCFNLEKEIHSKLKSKRIRSDREWFKITEDRAKELIKKYNGVVNGCDSIY
jgi:hypothetical protein